MTLPGHVDDDIKKVMLVFGKLFHGALGFWKALRQIYGQTRWQRCWVHKTANVLDKLPKALQAQAEQRLQAIWMAPDRRRAEMAFDLFIAAYEGKYPKAAGCLTQNREVLSAFYDFPAEHWGHIRTTNPGGIDVCHRTLTYDTRGCLSRATMLAMAFNLCQSAAKRWYRLRAAHYLTEVMQGMAFKDGRQAVGVHAMVRHFTLTHSAN